jgi:hypothetical protein
MINIERSENSPESLNTIEIRDYINSAVQHLKAPQNFPKPDKPGPYRNSDLLEAFDCDFFSKCYLTEQKFQNSWIMDIEHFVPQSERSDLVYEWNNLFPAEHYTNMIKPRITPNGGYLNPCEPNEDVEKEILYSLSVHGFDPKFTPNDSHNLKAVNTCKLLNRVHNGHNADTFKATETLRHAIHKKYVEILNKIIEFQSHPDGSQQKYQALRELQDHLSRRSSFTMLSRSIPALNLINEDLFD